MKKKIILAVVLIICSALTCYAKTYLDVDGGGYFVRIYEKNHFKNALKPKSGHGFLVTNIVRDQRNDNILAYNIFNNQIAVFKNGIIVNSFCIIDKAEAENYFEMNFVNLLTKIISSENNYVIKIDKIDIGGRFFLRKAQDGSVEVVEAENLFTIKSLTNLDYNDSIIQISNEKMLVVGRLKNDMPNSIGYFLYEIRNGRIFEISSGQYTRSDKKTKPLGIADIDVVNGNILLFDSNDFPSFIEDKYSVFNLFHKKIYHIDNHGTLFFFNRP